MHSATNLSFQLCSYCLYRIWQVWRHGKSFDFVCEAARDGCSLRNQDICCLCEESTGRRAGIEWSLQSYLCQQQLHCWLISKGEWVSEWVSERACVCACVCVCMLWQCQWQKRKRAKEEKDQPHHSHRMRIKGKEKNTVTNIQKTCFPPVSFPSRRRLQTCLILVI